MSGQDEAGGLNFHDMNRLSLVSMRIEQYRRDVFLGHGTGFLVRPPNHGSQVWLVTAWHVVTARQPTDPSTTIAGYRDSPDTLSWHTMMLPGMPRRSSYPGGCRKLTPEIEWREHPSRASGVDLVALPLPEAFRATTFEMPWAMLEAGTAPVAGTDAMIVGFPFGSEVSGSKDEDVDPPIWKRATVASEPRSPSYGEGRFLVDALSRPGMSGAPIYRIRHAGEPVLDDIFNALTEQYDRDQIGFEEFKDKLKHAALSESPQAAQRYEFAGVYTGRLTGRGPGLDLGVALVPEVISGLFDQGVAASHPMPASLITHTE